MIQISETEYITEAQHAASMVEGSAKSSWVGVSRVVNVRLPVTTAIEIQVLAHKGGITRNAMMGTLLKVGIEEVRKHLSDETLLEMTAIASEIYATEFPELEGETS